MPCLILIKSHQKNDRYDLTIDAVPFLIALKKSPFGAMQNVVPMEFGIKWGSTGKSPSPFSTFMMKLFIFSG
jgi:hypothetical protein